MTNEQQGNVQSTPDTVSFDTNVTEEDTNAFFDALDSDVNSGILEQADDSSQSTTPLQGNAVEMAGNSEVQNTEYDTLQKRYSDSSREGKRLSQKLSDLEPYLPILDAMKDDPNLVTHVRGYFQGGGQAPTSIKDNLGLDEDFVFDPDEAISTPESDSAKVLTATIDGIVQRRLGDSLGKQQVANERLNHEADFRQRHELNDDQWGDFMQFAKEHKLSLDDILFIKNRDSRDQAIAQDATKQVKQQMQKVQSRPSSMATAGSAPVESSPDDAVFNSLLGIDKELESAFS